MCVSTKEDIGTSGGTREERRSSLIGTRGMTKGEKKALERTARLDTEDSQSDTEEDTKAYFNSTRLNRGL
jgi:hypothetical protein